MNLLWLDNPGTFNVVSNTIMSSVPILNLVTNGDIALTRGISGRGKKIEEIVRRVNTIRIEQVQEGQKKLDTMIDIALVISFSLAQRLKPYLPITLPDTREGFKALKEITISIREQIESRDDKEKLAESLTMLGQVLRLFEDELITKIMLNPRMVDQLKKYAQTKSRRQLFEIIQKDDTPQIEGLKNEIVQRKIAKLRDIKIRENIDGEEREFSQLDSVLYQIIEDGNLTERLPEAREQMRTSIEEREKEAVELITRRRVTRKVAGLMLSDPLVTAVAAKIAKVSEEQLKTMQDDKGKLFRFNLASQLLGIPEKKFARMGLLKFPKFGVLFEEEKTRLKKAIDSNDPFLFLAQLDSKEFELIRTMIPNIFRRRLSGDNRAIFTFAREEMQKKLMTAVSEDELIELIAEKLFAFQIRSICQEVLDQSVRSVVLDFQELINNPLILFNEADEILNRAQKNIQVLSMQMLTSAQQELKGIVTQPELEKGLLAANPNIVTLQRNEKLEKAFEIEHKKLGPIAVRKDISSSEGPFRFFPEYKIRYPDVVVQALSQLYAEYNQAFQPLVETNKESGTDYQYCLTGPNGSPVNFFVQIDMVGLPDKYLQVASRLDVGQVREDLRGRIFEIENSLAMYQLLMKNFSYDGQPSFFDVRFRQDLEEIRHLFKRPIALLAVTKEKYELMKLSEFGKQTNEPLTTEEVKQLCGFDAFFSPEEFEKQVKRKGNDFNFLLYVRSSEPIAKLRNPDLFVEQPLLRNPALRKTIKANAITFNIDGPELPLGSPKRINDTKAYLVPMGMAYPIYSMRDFKSPRLRDFLKSRGVDISLVDSEQLMIRAKPMQTSYGCYGHFRGKLGGSELKRDLIRNLLKRGPYLIQPEITNATIIDDTNGEEFMFIDRNFLSCINGRFRFLGGERTLMPISSIEAVQGRIHGNESSITAEIFNDEK